MHNTYMAVIGAMYPNVECYCPGDGSIYGDIVWTGGQPLPLQTELDSSMKLADQSEAWSNIKNERDFRKANGIKVNVTIDGSPYPKWFHSDDTSRIQQIGLVMMGANLPSNLQWKTMDSSYVLMTQSLALSIFQMVAYCDQYNFAVAEQHRQAMLASDDPKHYDFSSGWLPTFV
jgi:hypothetical protein